jgi:hypothetical protein
MFQEVRNHLQHLMEAGVIRRSKSPFSSNVVLVRKKNRDLRMCVDYRQLNNKTKNDAHALPCIEEILDNLGIATLLYLTPNPDTTKLRLTRNTKKGRPLLWVL